MKQRTIAVFGSSEPREGEAPYEEARRLGRLLAQRGYAVVNGGYGGVMEAVSRGAEEAGGLAVGVTCDIFASRAPNRHLGRVIRSADLHERTRRLVDLAAGYIVLRGRAGTLAELTMLWALERAGCLDRAPVILLGNPWRELLNCIGRLEMLEPSQLRITSIVDSPEDAVDLLDRSLPAAAE